MFGIVNLLGFLWTQGAIPSTLLERVDFAICKCQGVKVLAKREDTLCSKKHYARFLSKKLKRFVVGCCS